MVRNYLKIAFLSLGRHPGYTFINVAGLAIGMAAFVLILLYVADERSYDRFHANADRIVRVVESYSDETGTRSFARSVPALGPALKSELAGIEQTVRMQRWMAAVRSGDQQFNEQAMFMVDAEFFDVFGFELLPGSKDDPLAAPRTAVLTASTARRYFGDEDPIGKDIRFADTLAFQITGVVADPPSTSHLQFTILTSFDVLRESWATRGQNVDEVWSSGTFYTYALLRRAGGSGPYGHNYEASSTATSEISPHREYSTALICSLLLTST